MNNKTYRKDVSDAELETLQEGVMETLMRNVIPRRDTNPAPVKEEERENSAQEDINKVCVENKEYLESIFQFPFLTITGRADHQGLSPYMNDKIKKDLLKKGLIEEFSANLGHNTKGNVKFLVLTKSGYRVIGKSTPKEKELTCSLEHWFYQQAGHAFYLAKGYRPTIEWSLNGKRADLGIQHKGKILAIEFEITPKNAVLNVTKDIEAGFDRVLVACKNMKVKTAVIRKLTAVLNEDQWTKVKVLLLQDFQFIKEILDKSKK